MRAPRRRPGSRATERSEGRGKANRQLIRTVLLGTVAVGMAIVWMGRQYGIDAEETLHYLGMAGLFVGVLVALGALGFVALLGIRRLSRGRAESD